jgi:uncharacterized protein YajQ (UPF0234 family)
MKQDSVVKFVSEDNKITVLCDKDTGLGNLHDFLMLLKNGIVERIIQAQKEEAEAAKSKTEENIVEQK